ncbi:DUF4139 domain-containing protein [Deferribacter autotrophicus]|uniref:DUF4139 domain-containing protein n=1 Tax=Deferribacter autotrophicus TaxID=500465 RepID=A0A5A8F294_9BACT|nr:DUF4139 domain-containing protein [Deferribacter autotrophicus]KAA0257025.1 DUF4139 domain-containing protein [Deferribacter autotrophicus]
MKKLLIGLFMLFTVNFGFASTVEIYRDITIYNTKLSDGFVGFNKDIKVLCDGEEHYIYPKGEVENSCYLCNIFKKVKSLDEQIIYLNYKENILDNVAKNFNIKDDNSFVLMDKISKEFTRIKINKERLEQEIDKLNTDFQLGAKSKLPYFTDTTSCKDLVLKFSGISFNIENELEVGQVAGNKAKVIVFKKINLQNKSGVDIRAEIANLYFKNSGGYQKGFTFEPLVIRQREMPKMLFKAAPATEKMDMAKPAKAKEKGNRVYTLNDLFLPSNGLRKMYIVNSAVKIADFNLMTYPYLSNEVYKEITFDVPFDIENNRWRVKIDGEVFTNVYGKLEDGRYRVVAGKLYDIKVERKRNIDYQERSGFFGNKKKITDGYKIVLTNVGSKSYNVIVVDRVPVSADEKIEVKDVKVDNPSCSVGEKGKLTCSVEILPNDTVEINVSYTILYDKDIEITY